MTSETIKALILGLAFASMASSQTKAQDLVTFPASIERSCFGGRAALYDECGSQITIFDKALRAANSQGKTLLVSYGAEWCIWCHAFDEYIKGAHGQMNYRYSDPGAAEQQEVTLNERPTSDPAPEAQELATFAAQNFVLVHIESYYASDGYDVLVLSGADADYNNALPFIFTVSGDGQFAAALDNDPVETRRDGVDWYRGYNRSGLLNTLEQLRHASQAPTK